MSNRTINSYELKIITLSQQGISPQYDVRSYYGSCMRAIEEQSANFLQDYVNDDVSVDPANYEMLENFLHVLQSSRFDGIKKYLKKAVEKHEQELQELQFQRMLTAQRIKQQSKITPEHLPENSTKFNILQNKKKMHSISSTDMYKLGLMIDAEHNFSTNKIKNKFMGFVLFRIDNVLSGKMEMDDGFDKLVLLYAPTTYKDRYSKFIARKSENKPAKNPIVATPAKKTVQSEPEKQKKSIGGFFKKIGNSIKETTKNVFNKVKKPLTVVGILAVSLFAGKKAMDVIDQENAQMNATTYTQTVKTPTQSTQADTIDFTTAQQHITQNAAAHKSQTTPRTSQTVTQSPVLQKTINKLNNLKATNYPDRNMDVNAVANDLYKQFGTDTYRVVLASCMAPYALNNCTKFDIKPTTHNMIEYLRTHKLTNLQRANLDTFISQYVQHNNINMTNFVQYQNQR